MQVSVWVADWQYQCCGEWFEVGSWVSWSLMVDDGFLERALGSQAPARPVAVQVLASASADGTEGVVAGAAGGLRVFIDDGSERVHARGDNLEVALIVEDHHGDVPETMPRTFGRVRRIRLARFGYEFDLDERAWSPRPDDASLEDVTEADRWPPPELQGRRFAGFLVDLDVEDEPDGALHRGRRP